MTIIPPFLQAGDAVGVITPAGYIQYEDLQPGLAYLHDWGLQVKEGTYLTARNGQFAGTDEQRLADLQAMLDDPSVKAIFAARGGYGCSRIVDLLDWRQFKAHPKWLIGFSDITVLLTQIYQEGFASIHGPMIRHLMQEGGELAVASLKQLLTGQPITYSIASHPFNTSGHTSGTLIGGNLCLLAHLAGSNTLPDTTGKILFIEDIGEYYYNLDRMVIQLKRAGVFDNLAGLVVGQFSEMKDISSSYFGKDAWEIIHEHVQTYDYPKVYDFPVGHVADNRALPVGIPVHLQVEEKESSLSIDFQQNLPLL